MHQDTAGKAPYGAILSMAGMHAERPRTESVHSVEQSLAQIVPQQHKHVSTMSHAHDAKIITCIASMLILRVITWLIPLSLGLSGT